jgi:uncharacterized protein (TIGR02145 family)
MIQIFRHCIGMEREYCSPLAIWINNEFCVLEFYEFTFGYYRYQNIYMIDNPFLQESTYDIILCCDPIPTPDCNNILCETVLTIGNLYGYYGYHSLFPFGSVDPACQNITALYWVNYELKLDTNECFDDNVIIQINDTYYILKLESSYPGEWYYSIPVYVNPFSDVGGTKDVRICGDICTTTTTTTCGELCCYGLLYNWPVVNTGLLAPTGWHVPTDDEWTTLSTYLGGEAVAGGKLKSTSCCWLDPNLGATNETGFTALPGGYRLDYGDFGYMSWYANWWSSTESETYAWYRILYYDVTDLYRLSNKKEVGLSVRCLLDGVDPADPGSVTDYDGNVYPTVKIGTQVWMAENLKVTYYNEGTLIPEITDPTEWLNLVTGALCAYDNDWANVCGERPTTTTTTTAISCDCDTVLTVGQYQQLYNYGYNFGQYGTLTPNCANIYILSWIGGDLTLFVTSNDCCPEIIVSIDGTEYTLSFTYKMEPYCTYDLSTIPNPFPAVGETCIVRICNSECTTTTTTTNP